MTLPFGRTHEGSLEGVGKNILNNRVRIVSWDEAVGAARNMKLGDASEEQA